MRPEEKVKREMAVMELPRINVLPGIKMARLTLM
jgi:hypothetical protein